MSSSCEQQLDICTLHCATVTSKSNKSSSFRECVLVFVSHFVTYLQTLIILLLRISVHCGIWTERSNNVWVRVGSTVRLGLTVSYDITKLSCSWRNLVYFSLAARRRFRWRHIEDKLSRWRHLFVQLHGSADLRFEVAATIRRRLRYISWRAGAVLESMKKVLTSVAKETKTQPA